MSGRSKHPEDLLQDPSDMQDCRPAQHKGSSLTVDHLPGYLQSLPHFFQRPHFNGCGAQQSVLQLEMQLIPSIYMPGK